MNERPIGLVHPFEADQDILDETATPTLSIIIFQYDDVNRMNQRTDPRARALLASVLASSASAASRSAS